jgi:hypothetical protein
VCRQRVLYRSASPVFLSDLIAMLCTPWMCIAHASASRMSRFSEVHRWSGHSTFVSSFAATASLLTLNTCMSMWIWKSNKLILVKFNDILSFLLLPYLVICCSRIYGIFFSLFSVIQWITSLTVENLKQAEDYKENYFHSINLFRSL